MSALLDTSVIVRYITGDSALLSELSALMSMATSSWSSPM